MRMIEIVLIWWGLCMIVEAASMYHRWPTYARLYNPRWRYPLWLLAAVYVLVSPAFRIWEIFKPLFVTQQYKVQIEIFRYDGRNAKVQSDVLHVPGGGDIATELVDGDTTISAIYYQVVTIHEEGVIEARTKR